MHQRQQVFSGVLRLGPTGWCQCCVKTVKKKTKKKKKKKKKLSEEEEEDAFLNAVLCTGRASRSP
eukprot:2709455-Amphidinium_carterae.2